MFWFTQNLKFKLSIRTNIAPPPRVSHNTPQWWKRLSTLAPEVLFLHLWRHLFGVKLKRLINNLFSNLFPYLTAQNRCPLPVRTWSCQLHHPNKETFLNISSSHAGFLRFFFFFGWSGSGHRRRADGRWLYHPGTADHLRDGGGVFRIVFFSEVQRII